MTTQTFETIASQWLATAKHPKYQRLYTDLIYQPIREVMDYLRANSFKAYIVTYAAFGNSTGDQQMLEWTGAGVGAGLKMLVHHDDPSREYAYGPAGGLPDTHVGTFSHQRMDEAQSRGWTVISMRRDWRRIFAFE